MEEAKKAEIAEVAKIKCMCVPITCPCGFKVDQHAAAVPGSGNWLLCPACARTIDESGKERVT